MLVKTKGYLAEISFFYIYGTYIGEAKTNSEGSATISYTVELPIGNYNGVNGIKAEFKGDPNKNPYAGSEFSKICK